MSEVKKKNSNMSTWDILCETDPNYTKPFNRGAFRGTDINPQWRWRKLTETFGPTGNGWGVEDYKVENFKLANNEVMISVTVVGFYKVGGEKFLTPPGFGQDYLYRSTQRGEKSDDEAIKKAFTDALGNAFKYLGLGADVYMGMYDDSKYTNTLTEKYSGKEKDQIDPAPPEPKPQAALQAARRLPEIPDGREHLATLSPDGMVLFTPADEGADTEDLENFMIWYVSELAEIVDVVSVCRENKKVMSSVTRDGRSIMEEASYEWTTSRLQKITDKSKLEESWGKISKVVNGAKNTIPFFYRGVVRSFKDNKTRLSGEN